MNYTQYYENQITEKIDQEERKLWQEFYTKRLPKRTEKFKRKYTGKPEELQKAIEEFETRTAGEYSEVIDEKLTIICGDMREKFYHEILAKLDQLSAGMPDKADSPKLDNQTIASEIITDQEAEIEKLKEELRRRKTENPDRIDRNKEDLFIRFQDYTTKLQYMLNSTIDRYNFDEGAITDKETAFIFGYNRGHIWTELEIARDYIFEIEKIRKELESLN